MVMTGTLAKEYTVKPKSIRDEFAMAALQPMVYMIGIPEDGSDDLWDGHIAKRCYAVADEMMKAREVKS